MLCTKQVMSPEDLQNISVEGIDLKV